MSKRVMQRTASDNEYLHKDFHVVMNSSIEYLTANYGEDAVRDYLTCFTRAFYRPLNEDIKRRGLPALREHFERIYKTEGGDVQITSNDYGLIIKVNACPAVIYLRGKDVKVAKLFYETTKTVNEVLCEGTDFVAEFTNYDEGTGSNIQRFYKEAFE